MSNLILNGDFKIGDTVKVTYNEPLLYGKIGVVVAIKYGSIKIEFPNGSTLKFGLSSSVELVKYPKERVVFT